MKREVVITSRAKIEMEELFEYLNSKWNESVKKKLSNKINIIINLIIENPEIFPVSNANKKVRKAVISKQSSLFHHYNSKHIVILSIFDTRQDPTKINKII